jgi:membrane protein implicated in regulation of membrane protease activity
MTGAAAVVLWKVMAAFFVGFLALAFKIGIVFLAVYFLLQILNGKEEKEEEVEVEVS